MVVAKANRQPKSDKYLGSIPAIWVSNKTIIKAIITEYLQKAYSFLLEIIFLNLKKKRLMIQIKLIKKKPPYKSS